jgi:hypothetical protein
MRNQVSAKSLWSTLATLFVAFVGLAPVAYFVSIEVGIAEAVAGDSKSVAAGGFDRYVDNVAFGVNERLEFNVGYGFIDAGTASMEVSRVIEWKGRPCYQIVTRANSNSFFTKFYKVDDRIESIVDASGMFSWRFEKSLREGGYSADRMYEFDQRDHLVVYKGDTTVVPPYVQDALSALYYVRTQPLEIGKSFILDNYTDGKLTPLEIKVLKKETVTVPAGTFSCFVVEPLSNNVGIFKHEGRLKVWLTDDRLRLPVLMKSKVIVGSISAELTSYNLGEIDSF